MTTITQKATTLNIDGVSGDPFGQFLDLTIHDSSGDIVPWVDVTDPVITVTDQFGNPIDALPTLTSPDDYQWFIEWTADQTPTFLIPARWALSATISGRGPLTLVAGSVFMQPNTAPGQATQTTANLSVDVGTGSVAIAVTLSGPGTPGPQGAPGGISITANDDATLTLTAFVPEEIVDNGDGTLTITL